MNDDFSIVWDGKEIPDLDDELTDEEKAQFERDCLLDKGPNDIPPWAKNKYGITDK